MAESAVMQHTVSAFETESEELRTVTLSCVLMPNTEPACSATSKAPPSLPLLPLTTTLSSTSVPANALAPPPPRPALHNT